MADVTNIFEFKQKQKLAGQEFSPQDILDFLISLDVVDLVWDEPCDISIFCREDGEVLAKEIALISFLDWDKNSYLVINMYEDEFSMLIKEIQRKLLMKFGVAVLLSGM